MMNFRECLLSDLLTIKNGKDYKLLSPGIYPVFGSGGYMCSVSNYLYDGDSILLPRKGTLSNIQFYSGKFWTVDTCYYSIINNNLVEPYYLYLFLKQLDLSGYDTGASIPSMTAKTYYGLRVSIPTIEEQKKIIKPLKDIDALCSSNKHRITLLEETAHELYKEWFVRMRFPGYKNALFEKGKPKEWRVLKVTDLLDVKYGKDHKHLEDGDVPSYGSGGIMRMVNRKLYSGESVLIPRKGSLNNVMLVHGDLWTIDTMFYTIAKMPHVAAYAYYILSSIDMESFNTGAALPSMSIDILASMKVLVPNPELLEQFDSLVQPIFREIELLKKQNTQLLSAKDYLLPRLMSGKLSIE